MTLYTYLIHFTTSLVTEMKDCDKPIIAIHSKDGHNGCYAFNNCDFFADDWERLDR